jgi:hypothetical protein
MSINKQKEKPLEITFNYLKSNRFRVISADGAIGDETPNGKIFMAFYTERHPLPDSQTFVINDEGLLVNEVLEKRKVTSTGEVLREVEVGITFDLETAKGMVISLFNLIKEAESESSESSKVTQENS